MMSEGGDRRRRPGGVVRFAPSATHRGRATMCREPCYLARIWFAHIKRTVSITQPSPAHLMLLALVCLATTSSTTTTTEAFVPWVGPTTTNHFSFTTTELRVGGSVRGRSSDRRTNRKSKKGPFSVSELPPVCPGCIVRDDVTDVDVVRHARSYFSSPSMRRHRAYDDDDDALPAFRVVVPSALEGWRTQSRLAVRSRSKWGRDGCVLGLYASGSHNVVECPDCAVHHPRVNEAMAAITAATAAVGTDAFDETTGTGSLRYVQTQVERDTGKVCLTLVWNADRLKDCQPGLSRLVKELKKTNRDLWHSIWLHTNNSLGNAIMARGDARWHRLDGPEFHRERLPGSDRGKLYFSPRVFRQGNLDGFEAIATEVARLVPPGAAVCELYAGVGLLGLTALVHHFEAGSPLAFLRCSDENPSNPRCFERAVGSLPSEITGRPKRSPVDKKGKRRPPPRSRNNDDDDGNAAERVKYSVASASRALENGQAAGADTLIVDPPRKGLEEGVLERLTTTHRGAEDLTTLVYVSCGFDALARDADALTRSGWRLERPPTGYVLFPGSDHVETVACFTRSRR